MGGGVRKYQNKDGSLTELGKQRYWDYVDATKKPSYERTREEEKAAKKATNRYRQAQMWINAKKYQESVLGTDGRKKLRNADKTLLKARKEALWDKDKTIRNKYQKEAVDEVLNDYKKRKFSNDDIKAMRKEIERYGDQDVDELIYKKHVENTPQYRAARDFINRYSNMEFPEYLFSIKD